MGCEVGKWMKLAQDRVHWRSLVLVVLKLPVLLPELYSRFPFLVTLVFHKWDLFVTVETSLRVTVQCSWCMRKDGQTSKQEVRVSFLEKHLAEPFHFV
jgi:hypothetical protein